MSLRSQTLCLILVVQAAASTWRPERIVGMDYPEIALARRLQGVVEIECHLANDGTVVIAAPLSGDSTLTSAAVRNAMSWRFGRIGGGGTTHRLTYRFEIRKKSELSVPQFRFVMPGQVTVSATESGTAAR